MRFNPIDVLELKHSWPLFERGRRFDLGADFDFDWSGIDALDPSVDSEWLAAQGIGLFECELPDDAISWSAGVYDLFGLPRGAMITRPEAVALYAERSRATLERLRAHAIRHGRGFTIDAELRPADNIPRWMRLVVAPVCVGRRAIRLQGYKRDVSEEYL